MSFQQVNERIRALDDAAMEQARDRWNAVAKPIGSLGVLEDVVVRIAGMQRSADVDIRRRIVVPMCADNGVVAEGVTQTGQEVTGIVAGNMGRGLSSVCKMGAVAHAQVLPVDIGMIGAVEGVRDRAIRRGTANMAQGRAMTLDEARAAVQVGIDTVCELAQAGYRLFVTGEMGIGNTTTSSAVASVLLGMDPEVVTGKGAGLSDEGLARKVDAIRRAIGVNAPDPADALDVLSCVGGLDIAGMAGVYIGGALAGAPVLVDGFISAVSALVAARLCPACAPYMIATHASAEPAAAAVLDALDLKPFIFAGMRLGEGTGAVCALPMLDMALTVYGGVSFDAMGIDAYETDLV